MPVVTASSNAPAMPLSPSPRIASIMSCRCIEGPQLVVTGAVGDRRMAQGAVFGGDDGERSRRFAAARQDVEDQVVARRAGCQCLAHGRFDRLQPIGQPGRSATDEPAVRIVAIVKLAAQARSEEHMSVIQSLMRTSYAVFRMTKKQQ